MQQLPAAPPKPVVVVTGVSSGVGLALARKLWADERYRVVATARAQSFAKIKGEPFRDTERFIMRPLDVTSGGERAALVAEIGEKWGGVDILVNNAGIAYRAVFEHMTEEDLKSQLATNFHGPMELTRLVLPGMRRKRWGRILNVSSVSGMMAMPTMSAYTASKFALEGATEAIWYELRPWGVFVSLVQPGFIRSDSFNNVYLPDAAARSISDLDEPYHRYYHHMVPFIARVMARTLSTPESVADVILRTMRARRPRLRVPATFDAWLFYLFRRMLPRALYHEMLYRSLPGVGSWGPEGGSS